MRDHHLSLVLDGDRELFEVPVRHILFAKLIRRPGYIFNVTIPQVKTRPPRPQEIGIFVQVAEYMVPKSPLLSPLIVEAERLLLGLRVRLQTETAERMAEIDQALKIISPRR